MIGSKYLLDSSIVVDALGNNDKEVTDKVESLESFYINTIVLGELHVGVNRVKDKEKHLSMLRRFLQIATTVDIDVVTAEIYGEVLAQLYKKGTPIPTNDVWIAASAIRNGLTVVSKDAHFKTIDGLVVESW